MTTPRSHWVVSRLAAMLVPLMLGCATAGPRGAATDASASIDAPLTLVRFENEARDYVHVYLVSAKREWLLGRVEPGVRTTLRLPASALADDVGTLQLAVLMGSRVTFTAAREARETLTIAEPPSSLAAKRWIFSRMPSTGMMPMLQSAPVP